MGIWLVFRLLHTGIAATVLAAPAPLVCRAGLAG